MKKLLKKDEKKSDAERQIGYFLFSFTYCNHCKQGLCGCLGSETLLVFNGHAAADAIQICVAMLLPCAMVKSRSEL